MFKKATLLTCFVVGTISFLWLFQCIWVRKSDHQLYLSFMEKQHQIDTSSKLVSQNAYQTRCGVRKDIWVAEEPSTAYTIALKVASPYSSFCPANQRPTLLKT